MPTLGAQRIESLRGPASALYGVGAFLGVVQIITDPTDLAAKDSRTQAKLGMGDGGRTRSAGASFATSNLSGRSFGVATWHQQLASQRLVGGDSLRPLQDDQMSQFIHFKHQILSGEFHGLDLGFLYSSKESGIGQFWGAQSHPSQSVLWTTAVPYIKYSRDLTSQLRWNPQIS